MTRVCTSCQVEQAIEQFIPHKGYRDGRTRRCRTCMNDYSIKRQADARREALLSLGDRCVRCGIDDLRLLCIDHINGGGRQDRAKHGGVQVRYYRHVKENPEPYQLLCHNCNHLKRLENGEHGGAAKVFVT